MPTRQVRRLRKALRDSTWRARLSTAGLAVIILAAATGVISEIRTSPAALLPVNATTPCIASPAPSGGFKHIVFFMGENHSISSFTPSATPFLAGLRSHCGTSNVWNDANKTVTGGDDGSYNSKPSYAVLTNGQRGSVTGITDDDYGDKTGVDNIYNQLRVAGRNATSYVEGRASGDVCSGGGSSSGSYHDPARYYTDLPNAWCNAHDLDLSQFDPNNLPDYSMIIGKNTSICHDNFPQCDTWFRDHMTPLLDSSAYAAGDVAVVFLTDENSPAMNIMVAPSVTAGSVVVPGSTPVSHYAGLRLAEEMLGLPLLGDTAQAPRLLPFFGGGGSSTTSSPSSTSSSSTSSTSSSSSTTSSSTTTTTTRPNGTCTQHTAAQINRSTGTPPNTSHEYTNLLYGDCWQGGSAWLTNNYQTTPWETFHHSGAWNCRGPCTIRSTIAVNYGDSYRIENGGSGFFLDHVAGFFGHDDFVENDHGQSGTIDGAVATSFVGYSDQGNTTASNGSVLIAHSYIELQPTPTTYKPEKYGQPGTGSLFKLDGNSAKISLVGNTFVASVIPASYGTLGPPPQSKLGACTGNKIVWKGTVPFPANAKAAWLSECSGTKFVGA